MPVHTRSVVSLVFAVLAAGGTRGAAAATPENAVFVRYLTPIPGSWGSQMRYVDFTVVSTLNGHYNYLTFASPDATGNVKFMDIQNYSIDGPGTCLEYWATAHGTQSVDVKLWVNLGSQQRPVWQKLSDDAYDLMPVARVWLRGFNSDKNPVRLRLAAYSPSSNAAAIWFTGYDMQRGQAACESPDDERMGVLRLIGGYPTLVRSGY